MQASDAYRKLNEASMAELGRLFDAGTPAKASELAGWEWRGFNAPAFAHVIGIKKFIKGFFEGPDGVEGYNIPVRQNGLAAPWVHKPSEEAPKRFGFFNVVPDDGRHGNSILLNYGTSARNARCQVERLLRDYVVVVPGHPDILLGKAYLAFGSVHVPASWFILERLRRTSWKAD